MKYYCNFPVSYMEVTRELVHRMPTHLLPQGSEPTQLGGVFFQTSFRAFNWLTVSAGVKRYMMKSLHGPHSQNF
uniref:Uncharacterized protein n=1 Tax=Rhizophora mucronata TaxID=61149 RepID=A0A2P2MNG6_RHIMU